MKKLYILMLAVVLFSCGKDDNDDPKPVSKLVGTWTAVSSQTIMKVGDQTYEEYLISMGFDAETAAEANQMMEDLLTLTDFFAEMQIKADGTWSGDSEFVTTPVTGKWELTSDEKTLKLTNDAAAGEIQQGTITKLTDTDLWIEMGVDTGSLPSGTPTTFSYTAVLKFTRKK